MTLSQLLNTYYLARTHRDTKSMLEIADILVEKEVPELIARLAQLMIDRNQQERGSDADSLVDCHL